MILSRRSVLIGLGGALAAPAIVRAESLMPVSAPKLVKTLDAQFRFSSTTTYQVWAVRTLSPILEAA